MMATRTLYWFHGTETSPGHYYCRGCDLIHSINNQCGTGARDLEYYERTWNEFLPRRFTKDLNAVNLLLEDKYTKTAKFIRSITELHLSVAISDLTKELKMPRGQINKICQWLAYDNYIQFSHNKHGKAFVHPASMKISWYTQGGGWSEEPIISPKLDI